MSKKTITFASFRFGNSYSSVMTGLNTSVMVSIESPEVSVFFHPCIKLLIPRKFQQVVSVLIYFDIDIYFFYIIIGLISYKKDLIEKIKEFLN